MSDVLWIAAIEGRDGAGRKRTSRNWVIRNVKWDVSVRPAKGRKLGTVYLR
jgi:hypothetical protein